MLYSVFQLSIGILHKLKNRILFWTDFPLITLERWPKDFETAGKKQVKPLIL